MDYPYVFNHDCKSNVGYRRFCAMLNELGEELEDRKFSVLGKTCRIVNNWKRHSKRVECFADSPVLAWARQQGKRIGTQFPLADVEL